MKKILTLSIVALFCTATATFAQTDTKAKAVLEAVSKKISGMKSLKANFALHLAGANGKVKDTKKGVVSMKGTKYHITLAGQEIICDNKTVWTYMKDTKEVQVSNFNPNEQSISPTKLFTNTYDKEYTYKYIGTKKVNGKNCDVVELTPIDKSKQFTKLQLAVDHASSTIVGGNMWEKNGNEYEYEVSNFVPNAPIPDTYFTFNKKDYPGVEVVDLR